MNYALINTCLITFGIISIITAILHVFNTSQKYKILQRINNSNIDLMLNLCLKAAQVGTWQYDTKEDILLWSKEMVSLFGKDVLVFEDFAKSVHPDDIQRVRAAATATMENGVPYAEDYKIILPDGSVKSIAARGERYNHVFLGVAIDITDRERDRKNLKEKEFELIQKTEALQESNEELTKFAYITSHDLKAPLRALTNLSDWVLEEVEKIQSPSADLVKYIGLIKNRIQRMENLINGILEYSRVGRYNTEKEIVDLNIIVDEVIETTHKDGFIVTHNLLPIILSNKTRMVQIFANLIGNAIKHHDKKTGNVSVLYEELENHHKFRIIDDGPGIDPKFHNKIFDMFQTLGSKEDANSTGIGLTLVKKIIENKDGEIGVISELGKGSEFWFTIPKVFE